MPPVGSVESGARRWPRRASWSARPPAVLFPSSTIAPDASALAVGGGLLLALTWWELRPTWRRAALLVLLAALASLMKMTYLCVVAAVALYLLVRWARTLRRPESSHRPLVLGVVAGVASLAATLAWSSYVATLPQIDSADLPDMATRFQVPAFPWAGLTDSLLLFVQPLSHPWVLVGMPQLLFLSTALVSLVLTSGTVAGAVFGASEERERDLARATLLAAVLSGAGLVVLAYVTAGAYIPLPARYGMGLVAPLAICTAACVRSRSATGIFAAITAVSWSSPCGASSRSSSLRPASERNRMTPAPLPAPTASPGSVLVTGGAGFIGCALAERLAPLASRWVVLDNLHPQVHAVHERPAALHEAAELVVGDVTDPEALDGVLDDFRPDLVIHLAAETGTAQSLSESSRHGRVNVVGTTELLDGLTRAEVLPAHLVLTSSRAVYGEGTWRRGDGSTFQPGARTHAQLAAGQWDFPEAEHLPNSVLGTMPGAVERLRQHQARAGAHPVLLGRLPRHHAVGAAPAERLRHRPVADQPLHRHRLALLPARPRGQVDPALRGRRHHPRLRLHRRCRRCRRRRDRRPARRPEPHRRRRHRYPHHDPRPRQPSSPTSTARRPRTSPASSATVTSAMRRATSYAPPRRAGLASALEPRGRRRRAAGLDRPAARRLRLAAQTTLSGSSVWPVGPTWISVPISGHTPQS